MRHGDLGITMGITYINVQLMIQRSYEASVLKIPLQERIPSCILTASS
jgi:hypothetical protein